MAARRDWGRVRQLNSGRWQARYPGPDGLLRPAPDTFERRKDAADWLAAKRTEISRDDWINPDLAAVTLAEFGSRWIRERKLAATTREQYELMFENQVLPHLGPLSISKVREQTIRTWHARLRSAGVGEASIARSYRMLHAIFATALNDQLIRRNPCSIKGASQDRTVERDVLTVDEVFRIAGAIQPRYRVLILLAAFSSLRFGELAALQLRHVDLDLGEIRVRRSQAELSDGRRIIKAPKSGAGLRDVSVPEAIAAELRDHLARFSDTVDRSRDALVFHGPKGGVLARHNFRRVWLKALADADIGRENVHFHDLRHTGNGLAAQAGASTRELMTRMGHSSMRAALIYQHAGRERDREIAASMNANLAKARPAPRPVLDEGHAGGTKGLEVG
jgi:integrase